MKHYIRLARPKHWVKNILVLLPLICSGQLMDTGKLQRVLWAFLAFSFLASAVYCINDVRDRDKDRANPAKSGRPVASGAVSVHGALGLCGGLLALSVLCGILSGGADPVSWCYLGLYLLLNLGYSLGLKNLPLIDVAILAFGYLLRMLYGGRVTDIWLSQWLCLTVIAISFYFGLGKRRGEKLGVSGEKRLVLAFYSEGFLNSNMYMCATLAVVFYAMWAVDDQTIARTGSDMLVWTVPLVILLLMKYSLDIEGDSSGDPIEVLLQDKLLLTLGLLLVALIGWMIYF